MPDRLGGGLPPGSPRLGILLAAYRLNIQCLGHRVPVQGAPDFILVETQSLALETWGGSTEAGSLEFDDGSGGLQWVLRAGFVSAENHSARATRSSFPVLPALSSIAFTPALVGEVLGSQDFCFSLEEVRIIQAAAMATVGHRDQRFQWPPFYKCS